MTYHEEEANSHRERKDLLCHEEPHGKVLGLRE
jgi:hypothetical protein